MSVELKTVSQGDLLRTKALVLNEVIEHRAVMLVQRNRDDWGLNYFNNFHLWLPHPIYEGGRGRATPLYRQFGHFYEPRKSHRKQEDDESIFYYEQSPEETCQTVDSAISQTGRSVDRIFQLQLASDAQMDAFLADRSTSPIDPYNAAAKQLHDYCFSTYVLLRAWGYTRLDLCG